MTFIPGRGEGGVGGGGRVSYIFLKLSNISALLLAIVLNYLDFYVDKLLYNID